MFVPDTTRREGMVSGRLSGLERFDLPSVLSW